MDANCTTLFSTIEIDLPVSVPEVSTVVGHFHRLSYFAEKKKTYTPNANMAVRQFFFFAKFSEKLMISRKQVLLSVSSCKV